MLKTNIDKNNPKQVIGATGSIPEMVNDLVVLLSGIHTQLRAVSPAAAELFRVAVQKLVADDGGPCWTGKGNQTGIALQLPAEEE